MAAALYLATAILCLLLVRRWVARMSFMAAAILILIPFCFTGYALLTDGAYGPIDFPYATEPLSPMRGQYGIGSVIPGSLSDVASQMIPWRAAVKWAYAHHDWPLHNPFMLSGDILAAAAQPAAYSPFMLLSLLLPIAKGLTYSAAITFFLGALGAFLFARELGCSESAALIAAAGFAFSADLAYFVLWPLGETWALFPFVMLGIRRVVRLPNVNSIGLLTVAFVLTILAGHPETVVHIVFLGAIYGVFEIAMSRRQIAHAVIAACIAGSLALLLCAIYLLPILDAAGQSEEHLSRQVLFAHENPAAASRDVVARLATDIFPFLHSRRWVDPKFEPGRPNSAAVGSIVLALAMYAMSRVRSPESIFFTVFALFCILARAEWGPVAHTLKALPLLNITLNDRLSFAAAFAFCVLAALGLERMIGDATDRGGLIHMTIACVVIALGTWLLIHARVVGPNEELWGDFKPFAEIACLALVVVALLWRMPAQWKFAAITGLILWQRSLSQGGLYRTFPADAAYPPVPLFAKLSSIKEPFRITGFGLTFLPNMSALYELEDPRGYEALTLRTYKDTYPLWCVPEPVWFNRVNDLGKPFLSFLNIRYAVVWTRFPETKGWNVVASSRGTKLLENQNVIARAFVPRRINIVNDESKTFAEMSVASDFRNEAWIAAPESAEYTTDNGPGRVTVRERPRHYDIDADMERAGWVVVSESSWKGWRAYVDGRRTALQIANYSFLSVYVPGGRHRVKLIYLPQSFVVGRTISSATLFAILLFAGWTTYRRRI